MWLVGGKSKRAEMKKDLLGRVVHSVQVAHVTFSVTAYEGLDDCYDLYSGSEHGGFQQLGWGLPYTEALLQLQEEIEKLETVLERKRKGLPTANQLHFLFRNQIPIPLDLTWGQASDLIEQRMAQIEVEKEAKRKAKEELRRALEPPYHSGEKVTHSLYGVGRVLHAGQSLAHVQFSSDKKMVPVADIRPEN
jgi:hypothetical protein